MEDKYMLSDNQFGAATEHIEACENNINWVSRIELVGNPFWNVVTVNFHNTNVD